MISEHKISNTIQTLYSVQYCIFFLFFSLFVSSLSHLTSFSLISHPSTTAPLSLSHLQLSLTTGDRRRSAPSLFVSDPFGSHTTTTLTLFSDHNIITTDLTHHTPQPSSRFIAPPPSPSFSFSDPLRSHAPPHTTKT